MATLALNKQARHNYHILETYEAGLILKGYEVKAIKGNQANLKGSYISFKKQNGNLVPFLLQAHIPLYRPAGIVENYEAQAPRQLLLHRSEINRLLGKAKEAGLTLIPLRIYTKAFFSSGVRFCPSSTFLANSNCSISRSLRFSTRQR